MVRLVQELRAADPADDPDVILGIITGLFDALPVPVRAKQHQNVFRDNGLCYQQVLEQITVDQLRSLGITMGESMLVLGKLQEQAAAPLPSVPGTPSSYAASPAEGGQNTGGRRAVTRKFPEPGPSGFPQRSEWLAYQVAFTTGISAVVGEATRRLLLGINANPHAGMGIGYSAIRGDPDDQRVLSELVMEMPTALLNTIPSELVLSQSGLEVYSHITEAVMSASDESVGVLQQWFTEQPPLRPKNRGQLAYSLAEWVRVRDELDNCQAPQSEVQQRLSLESLVRDIPEAKGVLEAMKAASDTPVPVKRYMLKLHGLAAKYSSVQQAEAKVATVTAYATGVPRKAAGAHQQPKQKQKDDRICRHFLNGDCWRGANCRFRHPEVEAKEGAGAQAEGETLPATMMAHLDAYFAAKVAGVQDKLGVTGAEATEFVMSALQELLRVNPKRESQVQGECRAYVLADTGATVRVIGAEDKDKAVNIRRLSRPVQVHGSGGCTEVHYMGDLPGYGGLMQGCLIMETCSSSLLPVIPVCAELDLGCQIDQGGGSGRFTKDGEPYLELSSEGGMLGIDRDCEVLVSGLSENDSKLHESVMTMSSGCAYKGDLLDSEVNADPEWLIQHCREGHPYSRKCPWCVQGKMREKQHRRQAVGSHRNAAGSSYKGDLSGEHTEGVTGSTWMFVGVHIATGWGSVGLQRSKSAKETLVSIQSMETDIFQDSGGKVEPMVAFHHDDHNSFSSQFLTTDGVKSVK